MTDLEKKIAAKIPCKDTGIEVRKTFCSICAPAFHCGVDAYVKDGTVIKVEGTAGHPQNDGLLCTKGCSNRSFIYREDRLRTPLKRVGVRGDGKYEPISWDEAYDIISKNLLKVRAQYSPNAVAFYSGYQKWYRFLLERFAYDFGSVNFGTESSACFTASRMGWLTMAGIMGRPDLKNAALYVAWAGGNHHSRHLNTRSIEAMVDRGGKVIVVDPRNTPMATRKSILHLRIKPGTDGLLANCIAGIIIKEGWHDAEYIQKYVHGFEEYAQYVCSLSIDEVSRITTISKEDILCAAELIGTTKPMSLECNPLSITHQSNGYQAARSIFALSAITGNYDTIGGNQPCVLSFCEMGATFETYQDEFEKERTPDGFENRIGAKKFPVWSKLVHQMQCTALPDQILSQEPYPVRAIFALGLNHRIFPDPEKFLRALGKLDFIVDIDLFMTDSAKMADIILPACSSFEREEIKVYPGGFGKYYLPAIEPLYESRSDARILQELANILGFDDELLCSGYRCCVEHIFRDVGFDMNELIASPLPLKAPNLKPYKPYEYIESGCKTPSGKLELFSEVIHTCGANNNLEPLPKWYAPFTTPNKEYPFQLLTGVRLPNTIHTHLHKVAWPRSLRPDPMADISIADAMEIGLEYGDTIHLSSPFGSITVKANPTGLVEKGQVYMYHGYPEADVNTLLNANDVDPYSGFPAYKGGICNIEKVQED